MGEAGPRVAHAWPVPVAPEGGQARGAAPRPGPVRPCAGEACPCTGPVCVPDAACGSVEALETTSGDATQRRSIQ